VGRIFRKRVLSVLLLPLLLQASEDRFIFGSPEAILSGQVVEADLATRFLSERRGAVSGAAEGVALWRLAGVRPDRVLLRYSAGAPPEIQERSVIANLTPAHLDEVFLRRVTGVSDNPNLSLLTLYTENVSLKELVKDHSFELEEDARVFSVDTQGRVVANVFSGKALVSSPVEFSVENVVLQDDAEARFEIYSASWSFEPSVEIDYTISNHELTDFQVSVSGPLAVEYDVGLQVFGGVKDFGGGKHVLPNSVGGSLAYLGSLGDIPLWAAQRSRLEAESYHLRNYDTTVRGGMSEALELSWSARYQPEENLNIFWERSFMPGAPVRTAPIEFTVTEGTRMGRARGNLYLHPRFEVEVVGVGTVQVDPRPELNFRNFPDTETPNKDEPIKELEARLALYGRMRLPGADDRRLNGLSPYELSLLPLADPGDIQGGLQWQRRPTHQAVVTGRPLVLTAYAAAGGQEAAYQWYKDGQPLPGQNGSRLVIPEAQPSDEGGYTVQVSSGSEALISDPAVVKISPYELGDPDANAPEGFVYVPAGRFRHGSDREAFPRQFLFLDEGLNGYRPFYTYGTHVFSFDVDTFESIIDINDDEELEWSYFKIAEEYEDGRVTKRFTSELLVHRDFLISPMYVQQTAMSWERFSEIREWGWDNGYDFVYFNSQLAPGPGFPFTRWPGQGADVETNDQHPAMQIYWSQAVKTANALSEMEGREPVYYIRRGGGVREVWRTGNYDIYIDGDVIEMDLSKSGYRLPNYAEHQYFNRAGTTTDFWGGNISWSFDHFGFPLESMSKQDPVLVDIANYWGTWLDVEEISHMSTEVGSHRVNPFGLYDTTGNQQEWLNDAVNTDWRRWQPETDIDPLVQDNRLLYINHYDPSQSGFSERNVLTEDRMLANANTLWPTLMRSASYGGSGLGKTATHPQRSFRLILNIPRN
jgi:hypothetical protein